MPYQQRMTVTGLRHLLDALDAAAEKLRKKAGPRAADAGGRVILSRARQLAPRETGLMADSLGVVVRLYPSTGVAVAVVGPRQGFRRQVVRSRGKWAPAAPKPGGYANPLFYSHLVEHGTSPHLLKRRKINHPGHAERPFLRPALHGQQDAVRDAVAREIRDELGLE